MNALGDIKENVQKIILKYGSNDPFKIVKRRGNTAVQFVELKDLLGFHQTYKRMSVISIQAGLSDQESRFVCAHELGHAFLHPGINTPFLSRNTLLSPGKFEREANKFAIELLLPDRELQLWCCDHDGSLVESEIARVYGIPRELINLKKLNM